MQQTSKPASRLKVALSWGLCLGIILFWIVFFILRSRGEAPAAASPPNLVHAIIMLVFGALFLLAGVVSYLVVIYTHCFTFDFNHPVWNGLKAKLYVANIFVPLLPALGLGFLLSAPLAPVLMARGMDSGMAGMLPVMGMLGVVLISQLWILVWAPLERRVITRRLLAQGITAPQLQSSIFVGLSNPASGFLKRFGAVEEDIGALWISQDHLVYWGDSERFGITRDQLIHLERKADTRSTTMLGGVTHIILHVQLPDGSQRQIRLHTEGLWTMGRKRKMMDHLADSIARWHANPLPAPVA